MPTEYYVIEQCTHLVCDVCLIPNKISSNLLTLYALMKPNHKFTFGSTIVNAQIEILIKIDIN